MTDLTKQANTDLPCQWIWRDVYGDGTPVASSPDLEAADGVTAWVEDGDLTIGDASGTALAIIDANVAVRLLELAGWIDGRAVAAELTRED